MIGTLYNRTTEILHSSTKIRNNWCVFLLPYCRFHSCVADLIDAPVILLYCGVFIHPSGYFYWVVICSVGTTCFPYCGSRVLRAIIQNLKEMFTSLRRQKVLTFFLCYLRTPRLIIQSLKERFLSLRREKYVLIAFLCDLRALRLIIQISKERFLSLRRKNKKWWK